ncbi:toxin HicA [Mycetocola lacteus]|uniref:Toxin HicA n=1 Tax=Mycetocola lacteus TaxID=76637 RepID=A0A3L7AV13_9MICO|nr:toxin HicA [Mycetocola lacteus]
MANMMKVLIRMKQNPSDVRFTELARVCDHYFGEPRQNSTAHRVYRMPWPGDPRVNIQNIRGRAKAYQVKQVLAAIAKLTGESA